MKELYKWPIIYFGLPLFWLLDVGHTAIQKRNVHFTSVNRCHCTEYWECFRSGGNFSSYCGLDESEVCCRSNNAVKPRPFRRSLQSKCGRKGTDSGLVGVAEPNEWPWHAAILEKANHIYLCGASLIDENWVLTAAHCIYKYSQDDPRTLTIRLGEYDIRNNVEFHRHEEYDISRIHIHSQYRNSSLWYDLALLHLRFPVQRRPNIDVVCVPRLGIGFEAKRNCYVTGWGRRREGEKFSQVLKEVPVSLWPDVRCEAVLGEHLGIKDDKIPVDLMLCAGDQQHDACDGDGGGPLVCEDAGQWYQVGIVSFGLGCGQKDTPGIYTKLNKFEKWIRKTIQSNTRHE